MTNSYDPARDQNVPTSTEVMSQARGAVEVTPDDDNDLEIYAKALYIGSAGSVAVIPVNNDDDQVVIFENHPVGYMPVQVRRVMDTDTTASGIVALLVNANVV